MLDDGAGGDDPRVLETGDVLVTRSRNFLALARCPDDPSWCFALRGDGLTTTIARCVYPYEIVISLRATEC